ncbi:MAG: YceI family protein [Taibaiella sp.]|nr:YceI family protein [Taibaiella sp.]
MVTTKWALDPTHSEIQFKVKHLMISKVTGQFQKFDASIETEGDDLSTAKISFSAEVNSISTNNEQRDAHLKTGDFFDAENHPQLTFVSSNLEKIDDENYKMHGTLTMRGASKEITLDVEFGGMMQDPWGNTRVGFTISGKINRKDYGVSFGLLAETASVMVSDEVGLHAQAEFVKVTAPVAAMA